jgi:WD40 repeat protein
MSKLMALWILGTISVICVILVSYIQLGRGKSVAKAAVHARTNALVFAKDGAPLYCGCSDRVARVVYRGRNNVVVWRGHQHSVLTIAISDDGKTAVTGGVGHDLILWDAATGKPFRIMKDHTRWVHGVVFLGDGFFASASSDGTVKVRNVGKGDLVETVLAQEREVLCLAISSNLTMAASGDSAGRVIMWERGFKKKLFEIDAHNDLVNAIAFSADADMLVSVGADKMVRGWHTSFPWGPVFSYSHDGPVLAVATTKHIACVATAGADKTVRIWNTDKRAEEGRIIFPEYLSCLAFSPDGTTLVGGGAENHLYFIDVRSWKIKEKYNFPE